MFLPALKDLSQLPISCRKGKTEYVSGELNTCRRVTAPFNNMQTLKFKAQLTFLLLSIKCLAAPPSFQLCCLNCAQRFDLITVYSAVAGRWDEMLNI